MGAVLLLCYDLLAAFRNVFAHSDKAVGTEDILYWLCCAFLFFGDLQEQWKVLRFYGFRLFIRSVYLQQGPRRYFCKNAVRNLWRFL
ncbi:MAG: spore cortex biosynthesis protein YabQ [Blautia obeum]